MTTAAPPDTPRMFTSHLEQVPPGLSYPNIKLANFIELELTDLQDNLLLINNDNYKNHLKECLSKSYNVFHEMQKLYAELGMSFLYGQSKKLIACFGVIFVFLMGKVEKLAAKPEDPAPADKQQTKHALSEGDGYGCALGDTKNRGNRTQLQKYKRNKGVHLYNESYARCLDYNLAAFREYRDRVLEGEKTQEQRKLIKLEKDRKFKMSVIDELNDHSHLRVDGEELYYFLKKQHEAGELTRSISLEDELGKIATFFKDSQHQALQFLKKQKSIENFHELTEGFNAIMQEYQSVKSGQINEVKDRINQIFNSLRARNQQLEVIIRIKQKQLQALKQSHLRRKPTRIDIQTQTLTNFDQQMKLLYKRAIEAEIKNEQMQIYLKRAKDEQKKQQDYILVQLAQKQALCRQLKESVDERNGVVGKLQKKVKFMTENNKIRNIKDPLQYYNQLSEQLKRYFIEELKQRGAIIVPRQETRRRQNTKIYDQPYAAMEEREGDETDKISRSARRRESSIFKRDSSQHGSRDSMRKNTQKDSVNQFVFTQQKLVSKRFIKTQYNPATATNNQLVKSPSALSLRVQDTGSAGKILRRREGEAEEEGRENEGEGDRSFRDEGSQNSIRLGGRGQEARKNNKAKSIKAVKEAKRENNREQKTKQNSANGEGVVACGVKVEQEAAKNVEASLRQQLQSHRQISNVGVDRRVSKQVNKQCYGECYGEKKETGTAGHNYAQDFGEKQQQKQEHGNQHKESQPAHKFILTKKQKQPLHIIPNVKLTQSSSEKDSQSFPQYTQDQATQEQDQVHSLMRKKPSHHLRTQQRHSLDPRLMREQPESETKTSRCTLNSSFSLTIVNRAAQIFQHETQAQMIVKENNSNIISMNTSKNTNTNTNFSSNISNYINTKTPHNLPILNQTRPIPRNKPKPSHLLSFSSKKSPNGASSTAYATPLRQATSSPYANMHSTSGRSPPSSHVQQGTRAQMGRGSRNASGVLSKVPSLNTTFHKQSQQVSPRAPLPSPADPTAEQIKQAILCEFEDPELAALPPTYRSAEQFRAVIVRLHKPKCGDSCRHIQRYMEIFHKMRRAGGGRRSTMRLHVEDMNGRLEGVVEEAYLPYIRR